MNVYFFYFATVNRFLSKILATIQKLDRKLFLMGNAVHWKYRRSYFFIVLVVWKKFNGQKIFVENLIIYGFLIFSSLVLWFYVDKNGVTNFHQRIL